MSLGRQVVDKLLGVARGALAARLAERILHDYTANGHSDITVGNFRIVTRSLRKSGLRPSTAEPIAYSLDGQTTVRSHLNVYNSKEFLVKFPEWYAKLKAL
jgi:hypothetical protein